MKTKKLIDNLSKAMFYLMLPSLVIISSCLSIDYTPSKSIIVSRSLDVELKDSAVIFGNVYYAWDQKTPMPNADIWMEGTDTKTVSDSSGTFRLRIVPGTYTIKCLGPYADPEFTMVIKDLSLTDNEKVEILFLHGEKSE